MMRPFVLATLFLAACGVPRPDATDAAAATDDEPDAAATGDAAVEPEIVSFQSGALTLRGYLWRPRGSGPFPAMLYNHGSEPTPGSAPDLGDFYTRHGYAFFIPHRRGQGLSPGAYIVDLATQAAPQDRDRVTVTNLVAQVDDVAAALAFLRTRSWVDDRRIHVSGCSYGGIETVLVSERNLGLRSAVDFAGASESWTGNMLLRDRLLEAVRGATVPIFFLQAANDYNVEPSRALSAEAARVGHPYQMTIYPPYGVTNAEGHGGFCSHGSAVWGNDVLTFLRNNMP
jgi:carboxymethylenebutenolidase